MVLNHVINGHIDSAVKQTETEFRIPRGAANGAAVSVFCHQ